MVFNPLNFLTGDKSKDERVVPAKEHISEEIKLRPTPKRGSRGKFVSKKPAGRRKKPVSTQRGEPASTKTTSAGEIKGPYIAIFYGVKIRKYYAGGKWYFSVEDLLPLGQMDPPLKSLPKLREEEEFNKVFEKAVKIIDGIPCAGAREIIEMVDLTKAAFPGPFQRWIEETAGFPFEEAVPANP